MALKGVREFGADIAAMARDPALADIVIPGAALLVLDERAENLIWSSPAARPFKDGLLADGDGRIDRTSPAFSGLQELLHRLSPDGPVRIERLRLDRASGPPSRCACRLVRLPSGPAVVVAVLGPTAEAEEPRSGSAADGPDAGPEAPRAPAHSTLPSPGPARDRRRRGSIRFAWQADPQGRFTHVSGGLAEAVGPEGADILGRSWEELAASLVEDPGGAVAAEIARRGTWNGITVHWRRDAGGTVPVELAGLALFGADRRLAGFRGFGSVAGEPPAAAPAAADEARPDREEPSAALAGEDRGPGVAVGDPPAIAMGPTESAPPSPAVRLATATAALGLSLAERRAFREIARALGAPLGEEAASAPPPPGPEEAASREGAGSSEALLPGDETARLLDRVPIGLLVHRGDEVLCANRALLDLAGYRDTGEFVASGGVDALFASPVREPGTAEPAAGMTIAGRNGAVPARVRVAPVPWRGAPASLLVVEPADGPDSAGRARELALELESREARLREQAAILDTATDGVIMLDGAGRILSLNRSAEALFGYDQNEVAGESFAMLFARETGEAALAYLEGLRAGGVASLVNDGREVLGRVRQGGLVPLSLSMGRLGEGPDAKFCAVLRDVTAMHKAQDELVAAKQAAEATSARKSELLAKISHEIRTPLNAIIGFAEIMLEERFGPVGNERYRDYLNDIRASGTQVVDMVDDLLDLAQVEAGEMALSFTDLDLNEVVARCVGALQGAAARERIVVRTSFAANLAHVVADERTVGQIAANVIANAIRRTEAGGQVIVSTAPTDAGEVAFRVRDTGTGMSREELDGALEPFRQRTAARRGGPDLGLPLTRALVEANRGHLHIRSGRGEGTLVEILFPPTRVLSG